MWNCGNQARQIHLGEQLLAGSLESHPIQKHACIRSYSAWGWNHQMLRYAVSSEQASDLIKNKNMKLPSTYAYFCLVSIVEVRDFDYTPDDTSLVKEQHCFQCIVIWL